MLTITLGRPLLILGPKGQIWTSNFLLFPHDNWYSIDIQWWYFTHVFPMSSKDNSYSAENLQSSKSVFDLDLWPNDPKINIGPPWVISHDELTHVWSIIIVCKKVMEKLCGNCKKFRVRIRPWPLKYWHKTNRGPPWVMKNWCIKYHHCMSKGNGVIVRKRCKIQSENLTLTFSPQD